MSDHIPDSHAAADVTNETTSLLPAMETEGSPNPDQNDREIADILYDMVDQDSMDRTKSVTQMQPFIADIMGTIADESPSASGISPTEVDKMLNELVEEQRQIMHQQVPRRKEKRHLPGRSATRVEPEPVIINQLACATALAKKDPSEIYLADILKKMEQEEPERDATGRVKPVGPYTKNIRKRLFESGLMVKSTIIPGVIRTAHDEYVDTVLHRLISHGVLVAKPRSGASPTLEVPCSYLPSSSEASKLL